MNTYDANNANNANVSIETKKILNNNFNTANNAYISNDSYNAIDNNSKLNNQLEVLSDAIIMRCCQCCGYSTQSKYALRDVNKCIDNNCALFVVKQQAMFLLYNFPNIK